MAARGLLMAAVSALLLAPASAAAFSGATPLYLHDTYADVNGLSGRAISASNPAASGAATAVIENATAQRWVAHGSSNTSGFDDIHRINGNVNGTFFFQASDNLVVVQKEITAVLYRVSASGGLTELRSITQIVNLSACIPGPNGCLAPAAEAVMDFGGYSGVRLERGETLALDLRAAQGGGAPAPIGMTAVLYDSNDAASRINVTFELVPPGNIDLQGVPDTSETVTPGQAATYSVRIVNNQPEEDVATVTISTPGTGFTASAEPTQITLPPSGQATFTATVRVPGNAAGGHVETSTIRVSTTNGGLDTLTLRTTVQSVAQPPGDRDGDGYSDAEEQETSSAGTTKSDVNDAASTPATDDDGDGFSNGLEFDAGTNRLDPTDKPFGEPDVPTDGGTRPGRQQPRSFLEPLGALIAPYLPDSLKSQAGLIMVALMILLLVVIVLGILAYMNRRPFTLGLSPGKLVTAPGKAASFTLRLANRRKHREVVDLAVEGLPEVWKSALAKREVVLEPRASVEVGLLVQPPSSWSAPSRHDVRVTATAHSKPRKPGRAGGTVKVVEGSPPPRREPPPEPEPAFEEAEEAGFEPVETARGPAVKLAVQHVEHDPPRPTVGTTVGTTVTVRNDDTREGEATVHITVNGRPEGKQHVRLKAGETGTLVFRWSATEARNEVRVKLGE